MMTDAQLKQFHSNVACKLIGIHGHAGSGKDTVADHIWRKNDNTYKQSFATPLKAAASEMFGIPFDTFSEVSLKEEAHPYWGVSPRQMVQFVGTELVRTHMDKLIPGASVDFWILLLAGRLNGHLDHDCYTSDDVVVIPDVRFQNEYDWILENGGIIIRLTRDGCDGTVGIPGHASEGSLIYHDLERNYLLENNGTIPELLERVDSVLTHAKVYPLDDPEAF